MYDKEIIMNQKRLEPYTKRLLLSIILPLIFLSIGLFGYTIYRNYEHNVVTIQEKEKSVSDSITQQINHIESQTMHHVHQNDFLYFSNSSDLHKASHYGIGFSSNLFRDLTNHAMFRGILLYNYKIERYYLYKSDINPGAKKSSELDNQKLLQQLTPTTNGLQKRYEIVQLDDTSYLALIVTQRYGSLAILISPTQNEIFQSFANVEKDKFTATYSADDVSNISSHPIVTKVNDFPIYLVYQSPNLFDMVHFDLFQIIIFVLIIGLFVFSIVMFLYLQHLLISPLNYLSKSFGQISAGDYNYRITRKSDIYEIDQFYTGFNQMLDDIRDAENESHRQQMDAAQAKLQYLQLQIRPHFYLNCLKNINSLAELQDYKKIQTLVISLSDYFRYNFQDVKNFVTVREELEAVQSYVDLCRCLYNEIELEFDIESEVLNAKCLPLSILTFTENAIKHGAELKDLIIRVTTRLEVDTDGDVYVVSEVANTGTIDEETLALLNDPSENHPIYRKNGVGIANVRYRMWLIYGDHYQLQFENRDGFVISRLRFPIHIDSMQK